MSSELKAMIEGLYNEDAQVREGAAARIFREGSSTALVAAAKWWENLELGALLLGKEHEVTVGVAAGREIFVKIRAANGMPRLAEVPSDQDAEEFELHFTEGVSLDILTSRAPGGDGAIARYLEKFGEGVQQVEFRCTDVDRAKTILKEKFGVKAIYPETRAGADGTRVNFFLIPTPDSGKVLIELYEKAGGSKAS
jgi:methylmalonyl-CoA/ethylmalonyl-CoA epimerase